MTTTNNNRKILHLKRWEMCNLPPIASGAGVSYAKSELHKQIVFVLVSNTVAYLYYPEEDSYIELASPALAGTFGAGASAVACNWSAGSTAGTTSLTATSGSTSTIVTTLNIVNDIRGFHVQIFSGPNAGAILEILDHTRGANATLTVATQGSAFTSSTVYRLLTPRWFLIGAGTTGSGSFRVYDFATNTYTTLANANLPASIGTDGKLVTAHFFMNGQALSIASGTATSGAASALTNTSKSWTTNQWTNFYLTITGGTGVGQQRTVSSNTSTTLSVSSAWAVQPDATSTYSLAGNDSWIYYFGNNSATGYVYVIGSNTWQALSPGLARSGAPGAGMSAFWLHNASDQNWASEAVNLNGRYIVSNRGGGFGTIQAYDVALSTWVDLTLNPIGVLFNTGSVFTMINENIYGQLNATGRWFKMNPLRGFIEPWSTFSFTQSTAVVGDKVFNVQYKDGATKINYIYFHPNTSTTLFRQMVI
jgi:hypothetical protein